MPLKNVTEMLKILGRWSTITT